MTRTFAVALLLISFGFVGQIAGQSSYGYAFGAVGRETGYSSYLHGGIGGDWIIRRGIGIAAEIGSIGGRRPGAPNVSLISANASLHIPISNSIVDPFVTGGITLVSSEPAWNWAAGVNLWLRSRLGLRLEFRDHVWQIAERHLAEFRFGLTFR